MRDSNTYLAKLDPEGETTLELLARDRDGKVWGGNCGSRVGGIQAAAVLPRRNQGAVSSGGSRAYFSTRPAQPATGNCSTTHKLRILERLETPSGPVIRHLLPNGGAGECVRVAPPCKTEAELNGDDLYQGASVDQSRVYLMSDRQLANMDLDLTRDLYLYDSGEPLGERLTQVSAGEPSAPTPGEGAEVQTGTVAISTDGSHVYFVAHGILTTEQNPEGASAQLGQKNLYLWDREAETTAFIGALDPGDEGSLWNGQTTFFNDAYPVPATGKNEAGEEVGGDGHVLLFISKAPLTADDTDGIRDDVFRYDAETDELERISKAGAGGTDNGAFEVNTRSNFFILESDGSPGTDFAERNRWASEDGETVVFRTAEGLLSGADPSGFVESYLWRAGQLMRLPGTANSLALNDTGPALSHDGTTIAFTATQQLLPQDGDTAGDVYALRAGGGFPNPAADPPCQSDRSLLGPYCKEPPLASPAATSAASASASSTGNLKPRPQACPKGKRRATRKGKSRCVKPKRPKQTKKAKRNRHANADRRAAK